MTAILLAAGVGKRMGVQAPPKCLLSIGGVTLLQRTLSALRGVGVHRVVLVVGYQAAAVVVEAQASARGLALTVVENPRYREGAILSLWAAREAFDDDLLIMDADVFCPPIFLERLVRSPQANSILVDGSATETGEEQMVFGRDGRALQITKRSSPEIRQSLTMFGESVGFLKLSREAAGILRRLLEATVQAGQVLFEHEQVYPELFQAVPVGCERVDGLPWIEIDTPEDLQRAEREILPRWTPPRCLNRAMAARCLSWVLALPVTPNQWTAVNLVLGLAAIACMADGRYGLQCLGALLFQAFYLVDNWDGDVARARQMISWWGGWFDVAVDGIVQVALPVGLAIGAARAGAPVWVPMAGGLAALGMAMDFLVTLWAKARGFGPGIYGDPARSRVTAEAGWRRWLQINLTHENFSLLIVVVLLFAWQAPFLAATAVGSNVFWIRYLWIERARLVGTVLGLQNRP